MNDTIRPIGHRRWIFQVEQNARARGPDITDAGQLLRALTKRELRSPEERDSAEAF